jgi:hypothetical protein
VLVPRLTTKSRQLIFFHRSSLGIPIVKNPARNQGTPFLSFASYEILHFAYWTVRLLDPLITVRTIHKLFDPSAFVPPLGEFSMARHNFEFLYFSSMGFMI